MNKLNIDIVYSVQIESKERQIGANDKKNHTISNTPTNITVSSCLFFHCQHENDFYLEVLFLILEALHPQHSPSYAYGQTT